MGLLAVLSLWEVLTMATCRGCGQPIKWIETRSGKAMPCDPEELSEWIVEGSGATGSRVTLQDPGGDTLSGVRSSMLAPGAREIRGYVPHWATCPNRDQFKRAK